MELDVELGKGIIVEGQVVLPMISGTDIFLQKKENLLDVENRETALKNLTDAYSHSSGDVLTIDENGNVVFSELDYDDIKNKPHIPQKVSDLQNDEGFITKDVEDLENYTKTSDLAPVATSGSYNDLTDKPYIPSIEGLATKEYVDSQDEKKVNKEEGKGLSSNDYTDEEKNKLSSIESGADKNVQADWDEKNDSSDSYIRNRTHYDDSVRYEFNGYVESGTNIDAGYALTEGNHYDIMVNDVIYENIECVSKGSGTHVYKTLQLEERKSVDYNLDQYLQVTWNGHDHEEVYLSILEKETYQSSLKKLDNKFLNVREITEMEVLDIISSIEN